MRGYQQSATIGCLTLLITLFGAMEPIERALLSMRFNLDTRPASGDLTVVQIDARTIQEVGMWPFHRAHHAKAIDQLREAGASSIAFDIELSRSADDADNAELVAALTRAGDQTVLPSFIQLASAGQKSNETIRTEPDPLFRDHAWLANVNVYPSADGRIWTMTYGGWAEGEFQYSMAAILAGRAMRNTHAFYVDYGIDINSIPRLSYIDLINGTFDRDLVEGKRIVVGGTAVELGDQLNLPIVGVVSGPVLQALAFETIFQGREIHRTNIIVSLALALAVLLLLSWGRSRLTLRFCILNVLLICLLAEGAALALQHWTALSLDTGAVLLAAGLMGIAITISELDARHTQINRERTEKENRGRMLAGVIQDSFDGVIIFDEQYHIRDVNAAARNILELSPEKRFEGCHLSDALPKSIANPSLILDRQLSDQLGGLQEITFTNPSSEERAVEFVITHSELEDGGTADRRLIFTITFRDVTERRKAEEDRDAALEEAISANRAKTQFLANMSHELRTPLNAIIGFSEIMHQQIFGALGSDRYVEYAQDIGNSGQHLLSIVNDILDVSRIETGEVELNEERLNVAELLHSVRRLTDGWPAAKDRNIVIDIPPDLPELLADQRFTKQVVLNLLSNAVKFSLGGSTITLSANLNTHGSIVIAVRDQGIGIPQDCLPKLTDAFYQVDATLEREFEGSGLGLTLVQKHMALHGGTLSFESEVGVGTTAILTFPAERTCAASSQPQSA